MSAQHGALLYDREGRLIRLLSPAGYADLVLGGIRKPGTVTEWCRLGRFNPDDIKKCGRYWLIKPDARFVEPEPADSHG